MPGNSIYDHHSSKKQEPCQRDVVGALALNFSRDGRDRPAGHIGVSAVNRKKKVFAAG